MLESTKAVRQSLRAPPRFDLGEHLINVGGWEGVGGGDPNRPELLAAVGRAVFPRSSEAPLHPQSPCRALSGGASRAIRIIRSNTSSHSAVSAASAPPSADPGNGQAAPSSVAAFSRYTLSGRSP